MEESEGSGVQPDVGASRESESQITVSRTEANPSTENEPELAELHTEADPSSGNENCSTRSADNVMEQLRSLVSSSVLSHGKSQIRICRVPQHIRCVNPRAYTPVVVSIGPIHHFSERLQSWENRKEVYFSSFISHRSTGVEPFLSAVRDMEVSIRSCYAESSLYSFSGDDFVKMILLDAIYILELFLRWKFGSERRQSLPEPEMSVLPLLRLDLVLLENQLPFFVLERLFNLAFPAGVYCCSLKFIACNFFQCFNGQPLNPEIVKIEHSLTDIIRASLLHLCPFERCHRRMFVTLLYSASELHDAGVKFVRSSASLLRDAEVEDVRSSSLGLLDLHFDDGVLTMSPLVLDDKSEALVRNVIALEQFCYWDEVRLTDYFIFLDSLIKTIDDVNLLSGQGILVSNVVGNKAALSMVKNLVADITFSGMFSDLTEICLKLNEFYNEPWHRWKARLSLTTLKNQYFTNPWRGAGTVAACLLLLLTLVQTITSILQVVQT